MLNGKMSKVSQTYLCMAVNGGLITILICLLSGCLAPRMADSAVVESDAGTADVPQTAPEILVAIGDSLTEGFGVEPNEAYPAQLEASLQANGYNIRVVNAGSSGETSAGALARIEWILRLEPKIVILATGGNDGLRGIDPSTTKQNIASMIERLHDESVVVLLAGMQAPENMGQAYTGEFRAIYPSLAEQYDVVLMPFLLEGVAANPSLNQTDAIHPTAEGYKVVAEHLYPYVVQAIARLPRK